MLPRETDVLIVGAGPTGLTLAVMLQQQGIDHVLIERRTDRPNTSRAAVIHAHTLEVLERIGVTQTLVQRGLKNAIFAARERDTTLFRMDFSSIDSRYPYLLMIPQNVTESVLSERLTRLDGQVHHGVTATEIAATRSGVLAQVDTPDGPAQIAARHVVGADGMHSQVRQSAGIGFAGGSYAESFILADVHLDWPLHEPQGLLFLSPEGLVVVAPLPDGAVRIVATVAEAPETPAADDILAVLRARGPRTDDLSVSALKWSSRFRVHYRLAQTHRQGPFLLMGDAAHVHSPAGGQGMNCGLIDACVLGELLGDILKKRRPAEHIDLYERLRRPAAASVMRTADRMTRAATMTSPAGRTLRNLMLTGLDRIPFAKRKVMDDLAGLSRRELSVLPR
ncbi:FAD-dependent oxidoreductase [Brevirhabdus sp.]|uniref:FAD-dependent oxidoreductase n=1 Tax=Brevirhabdus sp. TaxID=2004514 RepID=UPI00405974B0